MTDFFYKWKKAKPGAAIEPPPTRFAYAVQEAFYWSEILDNGGSISDFGGEPSPGLSAALSGMWRGRNRADNEAMKPKERSQFDENRDRYKGGI